MSGDNERKRTPIIVVGAKIRGFCGEVLEMLEEFDDYEVVGFVDNARELQKQTIEGIPVLGRTDDLEGLDLPSRNFFIAIGDNVSRGVIFNKVKGLGGNVITLVHPNAIVSKTSVIGEGSYIGPGVVIHRNVQIGDVCIIHSGAIIHQNSRIDLAVSLSDGAKIGRGAHIDDYSFIGMGSSILPNVRIGSGVLIDINSIVRKDVPSGTTMMEYGERGYPKNIQSDAEPDVSPSQDVYVAQPTLPDYPLLDAKFKKIVESKMLSNFAHYSSQLELNIQRLLSVEKALTFPNCTSTLMLSLKLLNLSGEVILPSFTFSATGHALVWNNLTPVFADINPNTFNIDPDDVEAKITDKTSAIVAVHIFGNPCDVQRLEDIAKRHSLKLIFDSAHALGSKYRGGMIGSFGDVECFSLSGTKVITSAEGGIATSNNEQLMERMHLGRNYGAGNDYDCRYFGINGKMSEFHAAIALESLQLLSDSVRARNEIVGLYVKRLSEIPGHGIHFQYVPEENVSTYKDFGIVISRESFGMDRDELIAELNKEGVFPKRYFFPPLHKMTCYQDLDHRAEGLENTANIANSIICLPIYSHMKVDTVEMICSAVYRIWTNKNKEK